MLSLLKRSRRFVLLAADFTIMLAVYAFVAIISNYGENVAFLPILFSFLICAASIYLVRFILGVYANVWRYANSKTFIFIVVSDFLAACITVFVCYLVPYLRAGIYGWSLISVFLAIDIATLFTRFFYQTLYKHYSKFGEDGLNSNQIRVAIIGAGRVGALLAEELIYNKDSHYYPICFVDTNPNKIGKRLLGVMVYADNEAIIPKLKELRIQEIFIALPGVSGDRARELLQFYSRTGCKVKIYDFPMRSPDDANSRRVVREIKIEDLLFRNAIDVKDSGTVAFYANKTILVTGGGGSIGSELCRQIAKCSPKKLVILDIYENNAYDIQQELIRKYKNRFELCVEIGSVRDRARLDAIFAYYKPDIVFHAAAHKHVPLMEHSNCEAIKNNVIGTYNTADMAEKYGVEKFILVSTDKAVNPTNVMGASKRLCEMVVQCRQDSKCAFAAVRFGNVLGSNGSVIPLFKRQIAEGGPLTITDRRIIRYFMTIPEASGLVMQGALWRAAAISSFSIWVSPSRSSSLRKTSSGSQTFVPISTLTL